MILLMNIYKKGRDFGMPSYNDAREALGFDRAATIDDISSDSIAVAALNELYGGIPYID